MYACSDYQARKGKLENEVLQMMDQLEDESTLVREWFFLLPVRLNALQDQWSEVSVTGFLG